VPARVVVEEDQPESLGLRVSAPEWALHVVSDLFWPGWSVTVDGDEREMYRADYLLRGVPIEPGEHTVRFRYAPARVRLGGADRRYAPHARDWGGRAPDATREGFVRRGGDVMIAVMPARRT